VSSCTKKNRKLQFILYLIVKVRHFMNELFKMALRVPKNSLDLECTHQEVLQKCNLTREFAFFLNLTRRFACKFQVDTFLRL